jgi:hypothetical protein
MKCFFQVYPTYKILGVMNLYEIKLLFTSCLMFVFLCIVVVAPGWSEMKGLILANHGL